MKKKIFFGAFCLAIACAGAMVYSSQLIQGNSSRNAMLQGDVEALSSCEITKGGGVKLKCAGEVGACTTSYMGYTLTCSGTKVKVN